VVGVERDKGRGKEQKGCGGRIWEGFVGLGVVGGAISVHTSVGWAAVEGG
jgi:hypothetical protein